MALKDWDKWKWSAKHKYYSWMKKGEGDIHAISVFEEDGWKYQIYKNRDSNTINIKNKEEGIKKAMAYMRTN